MSRVTGFEILSLSRNIGRILAATLLGFLGHLFIYYIVFRSRLQKGSIALAEQIRLAMGLPARVLQGGIAEEVQFRWGLMSLVAASGTLLAPNQSQGLILLSIGASAFLFALFHLIGARQIGVAHDGSEIALTIVDNTWGGIVFGWLFWKYGLAAAMISHALFHLAWFPIERVIHRSEQGHAGEA